MVIHAEADHAMTARVINVRAEFNSTYARLIPEHMHKPLLNYVLFGGPIGDFLTAVLRNEFIEAFARADDENLAAMKGWAQVMYGFVPSAARKAAMAEWQKQGGMMGDTQAPTQERST